MEAIAAAGPAMLGGARLPVAQPEDLVIYKAVAWRPQDQQDIERLLALHGARMDLARVRRHVQALGEAMEEDRIHAPEYADPPRARSVTAPHDLSRSRSMGRRARAAVASVDRARVGRLGMARGVSAEDDPECAGGCRP